MDFAPTTKLEAVNFLLKMIGEMPVNSLDQTQVTAATTAENQIDTTTRQVQTQQLNFNTDFEYELQPDENDEIQIPTGTLSLDLSDRTRNVVWRNGKLYDKDRKTYTFNGSVKVDITWGFEFEKLPEHVRQYIVVKAGREFQDNMVGSELLHKLSQQEEVEARTRMLRNEAINKDLNFLKSPIAYYGSLGRGGAW